MGKEGLTLTSVVPGQRGDPSHATNQDRACLAPGNRQMATPPGAAGAVGVQPHKRCWAIHIPLRVPHNRIQLAKQTKRNCTPWPVHLS